MPKRPSVASSPLPSKEEMNGSAARPTMQTKQWSRHRSLSVSDINGPKSSIQQYDQNLNPQDILSSGQERLKTIDSALKTCEEGKCLAMQTPTESEENPQTIVSEFRIRSRRSYSISMTDPISRATFESMPVSPATEFLARFAQDLRINSPASRIPCHYIMGKVNAESIIVPSI
jgi:hypothetical protein